MMSGGKEMVAAEGGVVARLQEATVAEFHPHLDPRRKVTKPMRDAVP